MTTRGTQFTGAINDLSKRFEAKMDRGNQFHIFLEGKFKRLSDAVNGIEAVRQNPDPKTPADGHILKIGQAAKKLRALAEQTQSEIAGKFEEVTRSYNIALIENSGLVEGPYGSEIRKKVAGMDGGKRTAFIQELILEGDASSLASILNAPAFLSSLNKDEVGIFKEQFFAKVCPNFVKARDRYADLHENVLTATTSALTCADTYSNPRELAALEKREADAAEAGNFFEDAITTNN